MKRTDTWPFMSARELWVVLGISLAAGMAVSASSPLAVVLCLIVCVAGTAFGWLAQAYSVRVVIFGTFIALLYAWSRDFAYLSVHVGHQEVFITEIVLIALGFSFVSTVVDRRIWQSKALPRSLMVFLIIGMVALFRGLPTYGVDAVRDSALCYYSLTFPLVVLLASDKRRLRALVWFCWAGWVASALVVTWKYVRGMGAPLDYDLLRYGAGAQALASISGVASVFASWSPGTTSTMKVLMRVVGGGQLCVGILLIQHRSLFIAVVGASLAVAYCCIPQRFLTALWVMCGFVLLLLVLAMLPVNEFHLPAMVEDTLARLGSIIGHNDGNSAWRLDIWERGIRYGLEHPLVGAGFGPSMGDTFGIGASDRIDPHNSYVAILYRMGLPGILAFGTLWVSIIRGTFVRCRSEKCSILTLGMALAAHAAAAIFAAFNVALEGPYMGVPFWMSLALLYVASTELPEVSTWPGEAVETVPPRDLRDSSLSIGD